MKKTLITLALAALVVGCGQAEKPASCPAPCKQPRCSAPGPVVAASTDAAALPQAARAFLTQYFPGASILKVENDFKNRQYEVDLSTGVDVDFDYSGNWTKIDAPDGATLPSSTLAALLPESTVVETLQGDAIMTGGVVDYVEEITSYPEFYVVEVQAPQGARAKVAVSRSDGSVKALNAKAPRGSRGHARLEKGKRGGKAGRAQKASYSPQSPGQNK